MAISEAVTGTQDTSYVFKWSDFTNGISGTVNETISIQTLPANGTLSYFNGSAWVDLHSPILVSQQFTKTMMDAGQVRFTPAAGESGIDGYNAAGTGNHLNDYAHFLYTAIVDGQQVKNNLMDVDIAPVRNITAPVVTITEDANHDGTITAAELGANTMLHATVLPTAGALAGDLMTIASGTNTQTVTLTAAQLTSGVAVSYAVPASGAQISVAATEADPLFANLHSTTSTTSATMQAPAPAPTPTPAPAPAVSEAVTGAQDTPYFFKWSDFTNGISGNVNETVSIQTLPADGTLSYFNGTSWVELHSPILVSQQITKAMLDAKQVKFTPDPGESGIDGYNVAGVGNHKNDYAHFLYTTIVNGQQVKNNLMDVDIAPTPQSVKVTGLEDTPITFKWSDFSSLSGAATDVLHLSSLPANGKLQVNQNGTWVDATTSSTITKADLDAGNVRFVPAANETGDSDYCLTGLGNMHKDYAQFGFTTTNGPLNATMTVDVAPVLDMKSAISSVAMVSHGYLPSTFTSWHLQFGGANGEKAVYITPDGKPTTASDPTRHEGYFSHVTIHSTATTVDKDGSEKAQLQLHVNQYDNPKAFNMVELPDGTVVKPDANGDYWVPADPSGATLVYVFREWSNSAHISSHQTVTATAWSTEVNTCGDILLKAKCNAMTSGSNTPLVLDLDGSGIHTTDVSSSTTLFDLNADGQAEQTGWLAKGHSNGLLAIDLNGDGKITSGAELFGDHARLANGQLATDGYQALGQYDSNHDGQITAADAMFGKLRVWVDANGDGVSQASELKTLAQLGIMSIGLTHDNSHTTQNNNDVAMIGSFTMNNGVKHDMADVIFSSVTPVIG